MILLDEPTSGLDPIGTSEIKQLIRDLREQGKTIVLSGHLLADMQDICDRIAILHRGELKEIGRVSDLLTVQDVTQIKARNLGPAAIDEIRDVIHRHGGSDVLVDHPDDHARRAVPADRAGERASPRTAEGGTRHGPSGSSSARRARRGPGEEIRLVLCCPSSVDRRRDRCLDCESLARPTLAERKLMSAFLNSWPLVWAQAGAANNPSAAFSPRAILAILWLFLASDPTVSTRESLVGGILTWLKAISLICLVCWVVSWLIRGVKERIIGQGRWFDYLGVAGRDPDADHRHAQGARRCEADAGLSDRRLFADVSVGNFVRSTVSSSGPRSRPRGRFADWAGDPIRSCKSEFTLLSRWASASGYSFTRAE